ncbi:prohibitin-3, mitochondrial-like [Silene latifolia]|uniref:prohibitin-3, mitochondrial-like n=1 Tax=Silene latifolia TaxID=37657 RepID=UPI003D7856F3
MADNAQQAVSLLKNIALRAIGVGIGVTLINSSLFTVDGGEKAVIFDHFRGVLEETVGEGTHFLVPWLQKPYIFDIRTRPHQFSIICQTKDLQMVNITLRVLSRPDERKLAVIFQHLGTEYDEKVLHSIGNEVLKAVVAQFNADQLITARPRFSALVRDRLTKRAKDFYIMLDDVAIIHLVYGNVFSKAVQNRLVAQQEADRSEYVIMKCEQEKLAAVIRAEGESEAAKLISEATASAGMSLIELRKIEAMKENAATMARSPHVTYVPEAMSMIMGMPGAC